MIQQDAFGYDITSDAVDALAPWRRTVLDFLAHAATTSQQLEDTLRADPAMPIALACRGLFSLLLARRELYASARRDMEVAQAAAQHRRAHRREWLYITALANWLKEGPKGALSPLQETLTHWPQDALAMKLDHAIRFLLGDCAGMLSSLERVLPAYEKSNPGFGYLLGCHAFCLEESGAYAAAERQARRAIALAPDDAWGLHAIVHVYDMTGQAGRGVHFMETHANHWDQCNNFRYHIWWHLALMHLDNGDTDAALALYDTKVRAEKTDDFRDIANAASLLLRLHNAGASVDGRWDELASLSAARIHDGCLAFADLHYMLALYGSGDTKTAQALLQRMQLDAVRLQYGNDVVTLHPGLAVARGIHAFHTGGYSEAIQHVSQALDQLQSLGGSHAQRDIFSQIGIEAALRAGDATVARALLHKRKALRRAEDGYYALQQTRLKHIQDFVAKHDAERFAAQ